MTREAQKVEYRRTLDAKPNDGSIIKPGELVDIVQLTELTLAARRIYNLLLANAWDEIDRPVEHSIPKRELMGTLHKGTDRVGDCIEMLMAAVVKVRHGRDGKWETERVNLLGRNTEPDAADGLVRYRFDDRLREIIKESTVFARLHREIMFMLTSKYSLALYEMIQKRGNMNRSAEIFSIEDIRGLLGVHPDKLSSWINLRNKALDPAMKEVSALSDFEVSYEPIRSTEKGRTKMIASIKLVWSRKSDDRMRGVERELNFSKVGRRARMDGTVEDVSFAPRVMLREDTIQRARTMFKGFDVYYLEAEWRRVFEGKAAPEKPDGAFIAWCKQFVERNPLRA